jgi:hypothetical protein
MSIECGEYLAYLDISYAAYACPVLQHTRRYLLHARVKPTIQMGVIIGGERGFNFI